MELAKLILVIVMIGWAEDNATHSALSNKCVLAFWWLGGGPFRLVESVEMLFQYVGDCFINGKPQSVIECANKERLYRFSFRVLFNTKSDGVALRLLQNHLRDVKERISTACHLNLAREGFDALLIGQQAQIELWQRLLWFAALPIIGAFAMWPFAPA